MLDEAQPALCPNLLASWGFAAALMLPLVLACLVIAVAGVAEWPARKIIGVAKLHRYVYSTAGAMLSAAAVQLCIRKLILPYHAQYAVAMFVYTGVCALLVALAMLSVGETTVIRKFSDLKTYYLECTTMLIALGQVALLHSALPTLAWLSLPATIVLQRQAVRADLRAADDPGARPMNQEAWLLIAREVIAACPVGAVMRVDTADPAAVSYLARVQAGCDAIGMAGNSGLAVLLTECPGPNADALAVRLRSVLYRQGIEAHVAVAAKPRDGQSLDDLLAVSEAELIARVAATRVARSDSPEA